MDLRAALEAVRAELPAMAHMGTLKHVYGLAARLAAWRVLQQGGDAQARAQLSLAAAELELELRGFADSEARSRLAHEVPWNRDVMQALQAS